MSPAQEVRIEGNQQSMRTARLVAVLIAVAVVAKVPVLASGGNPSSGGLSGCIYGIGVPSCSAYRLVDHTWVGAS